MAKVPTRFDGPPESIAVYRKASPTEEAAGERKKFYKRAAWRRCRALKLAGDPLCERCKARGVIEPATQVHHRIDVVDADELVYDLDNLEALCQGCHSRETMGRQARGRKTDGHG